MEYNVSNMRIFGTRLKELREEKGLTKFALGKAISIGDCTIGLWERCERDITSDKLQKIADFFDVSTDYLLGRSDEYLLSKLSKP